MRSLFALSLIFVAAITAAFAEEPDPMGGFYGNTWEYIGWDGTKFIHIDADATFAMLHWNGKIFQGTWVRDETKACFTVPSANETSCFKDVFGYKIGERWTGTHHTGKPYDGIIHPGRTELEALKGERFGKNKN